MVTYGIAALNAREAAALAEQAAREALETLEARSLESPAWQPATRARYAAGLALAALEAAREALQQAARAAALAEQAAAASGDSYGARIARLQAADLIKRANNETDSAYQAAREAADRAYAALAALNQESALARVLSTAAALAGVERDPAMQAEIWARRRKQESKKENN